jgi:hypothetical protein
MTIEQFRDHNETMLVEKEQLAAALVEAEAKLRAQSEHERLLGEVQKALQDLPRTWAHLEPEERKEVLRLVINGLTLGRTGEGIGLRMDLRYGPRYEALL